MGVWGIAPSGVQADSLFRGSAALDIVCVLSLQLHCVSGFINQRKNCIEATEVCSLKLKSFLLLEVQWRGKFAVLLAVYQ